MVKFTKEKDEILIELVKVNRVLYDASVENFKNNILKHKHWEEISAAVGIPVSECKKRWKSLRDQFHKKKKGDATGAERTSWGYMNLMSFLSDTVERRETVTNYTDYSQQEQIEFVDEETTDEEQRDQQNEDQRQQQKANEIYNFYPNREEVGDQNKKSGTKRNSLELITKMMEKRYAQRSTFYDKILNKAPEIKTPVHKFFESMADIVDKLPPQLQAEVRLKVCEIVTEVELKHYEQSTL